MSSNSTPRRASSFLKFWASQKWIKRTNTSWWQKSSSISSRILNVSVLGGWWLDSGAMFECFWLWVGVFEVTLLWGFYKEVELELGIWGVWPLDCFNWKEWWRFLIKHLNGENWKGLTFLVWESISIYVFEVEGDEEGDDRKRFWIWFSVGLVSGFGVDTIIWWA